MNKLRCWPGCAAQVVRSKAGNEGKVVTCIRLATEEEKDRELLWSWAHKPVWVVDKPMRTVHKHDGSPSGSVCFMLADEWLAPLTPREGDISDEEVRDLYAPNSITPEDAELLREALKQWAEEQR